MNRVDTAATQETRLSTLRSVQLFDSARTSRGMGCGMVHVHHMRYMNMQQCATGHVPAFDAEAMLLLLRVGDMRVHAAHCTHQLQRAWLNSSPCTDTPALRQVGTLLYMHVTLLLLLCCQCNLSPDIRVILCAP